MKISGAEFGNDQFIKKLEAAGITKTELETAKSQGPEAFKQLLESKGIEAPEPPRGMNKKGGNDLIQKLKSAGANEEEIQAAFMQGPEAMRKLMEKYGIQPSNSEMKPPHGPDGKNSSIIQQLKEAGVSKSELDTSLASGFDGMQALFEKYGLVN